MANEAIGLDIGHSAVKVSVGERFIFPTAVMPAVDLSVNAKAANDDTVTTADGRFFVGETAIIHSGGRVLDGLKDDWVKGAEHRALMKAAHRKATYRMGVNDTPVVMGLPSRLHATQKDALKASAVDELQIQKNRVFVLPQPLAAFYRMVLDERGVPSGVDYQDERWYIIDIGYYTTDFGCVDHGVWSARGQESTAGMHVAAQGMKHMIESEFSMETSIRDAEKMLRTGGMRDHGQIVDVSGHVARAIQPVAMDIIDKAVQVFGASQIRSSHGILVAGGGASLLGDAIRTSWKHARQDHEPRFAVAEGLRRFGLAKQLSAA